MKIFLLFLMGLFLVACSKIGSGESEESKRSYRSLSAYQKEQPKQLDAQSRKKERGRIITFGDPSRKAGVQYAKVTIKNFNKIRRGMGLEEVKKIMGPPTRILKGFSRDGNAQKRGGTYIWDVDGRNVNFQVRIEKSKVDWTAEVSNK